MMQPGYNNQLNYVLHDSSVDMQMHFASASATRKLNSRSLNHQSTCPLESNERLAAYLVHEPHVAAILQLLLEMSEEQRRMSLMMMQCIGLGAGSPPEGK